MRYKTALRLSALLFIALLPFAAVAQDAKQPAAKPEISRGMSEIPLDRQAFTGNEARIAAMNYVNADCTSGPLPSLRITTPPKNGNARMEEITMPLDRAKEDPRASCIGKPIRTIAVFYKSNDGYVGPDDVVIDVDFRNGTIRRFNYKITVR